MVLSIIWSVSGKAPLIRRLPHLFPEPCQRPAPEPAVDDRTVAKFRQVRPRGTRSGDPEYSVRNEAAAELFASIRVAGCEDRRVCVPECVDYRLALPVLLLGEEGSGLRGSQEKREDHSIEHPGGDAAVGKAEYCGCGRPLVASPLPTAAAITVGGPAPGIDIIRIYLRFGLPGAAAPRAESTEQQADQSGPIRLRFSP